MNISADNIPRLPVAPNSIQKGVPLKHLFGAEAVDCLAQNILLVHPQFDEEAFRCVASDSLESRLVFWSAVSTWQGRFVNICLRNSQQP
jgi:hypothetical protein